MEELSLSMKKTGGERSGIAADNAAKTHCKRGHEFTPENTYMQRTDYGGGVQRVCKKCKAEYHNLNRAERLRRIKKRVSPPLFGPIILALLMLAAIPAGAAEWQVYEDGEKTGWGYGEQVDPMYDMTTYSTWARPKPYHGSTAMEGYMMLWICPKADAGKRVAIKFGLMGCFGVKAVQFRFDGGEILDYPASADTHDDGDVTILSGSDTLILKLMKRIRDAEMVTIQMWDFEGERYVWTLALDSSEAPVSRLLQNAAVEESY
jgi:hypothetical protein